MHSFSLTKILDSYLPHGKCCVLVEKIPLTNFFPVLNAISSRLESTEDVFDHAHLIWDLENCCQKSDIYMTELCCGVPFRNYEQPISFFKLWNCEFWESIMRKDIDSLRFYITEVDELIKELPEPGYSNLSWYDNIAKSLDWSRTRKSIIKKFLIFNEKLEAEKERRFYSDSKAKRVIETMELCNGDMKAWEEAVGDFFSETGLKSFVNGDACRYFFEGKTMQIDNIELLDKQSGYEKVKVDVVLEDKEQEIVLEFYYNSEELIWKMNVV